MTVVLQKDVGDTVREEQEEVTGARQLFISLEGRVGRQSKGRENKCLKVADKDLVKRPEKEAVKRPDKTVTLQGEETEFSKVFAQLRGQARVD